GLQPAEQTCPSLHKSLVGFPVIRDRSFGRRLRPPPMGARSSAYTLCAAEAALERRSFSRTRCRVRSPEASALPPRNRWFADSVLEGTGFELPVPREIGNGLRPRKLIPATRWRCSRYWRSKASEISVQSAVSPRLWAVFHTRQ